MINWTQIETVLLDMDGTLLDLHFDDHFWQVQVPTRFGERAGLGLSDALAALAPVFKAREGTLDWYCLDFWSRELGLDIAALKRETAHMIAVRHGATEFLQTVRLLGKRQILVTNAHPAALALKMERTGLAPLFDAIVSSHALGMPKEDVAFWQALQKVQPFNSAHTLLLDDSLPVLRSARAFGIAFPISIAQPSSKKPARMIDEFHALNAFSDLLPAHVLSAGAAD